MNKEANEKKILISGFYGFGNAGDEAVLEGLLKSLKLSKAEDITILTSNLQYTKKHHKNIKCVPRYSKEAIKALFNCNIFLSGGGSLLQNVTSNKSLYYYLFMLDLANFLGKKTVIYAQGIGPISGNIHLKKAVNSIKKCDIISVRDKDSQDLLVSNGISEEKIFLTSDPAFWASKNTEKAAYILEKYNLNNRNFITIALRNYKGNSWLKNLEKSIEIIYNNLNIPIIALPFLLKEDKDICKGMEKITTITEEIDWKTIKGIISKSDMIIGQRLHSLIFAASENIPFVTLSYDPKNTSFAKSYKQKTIFQIDDFVPEDLAQYVIETYNNKKEISVEYAEFSKNNEKTINKICEDIMKL